jgi:DNA modification methylase
MARPKSANPRSEVTSIRLTPEERVEMERAASDLRLTSLSDYLRHLHREKARQSVERARLGPPPGTERVKVFHQTTLGTMYHGNSLDYLFQTANKDSVNLIMTSPPFGLVRKKSYGNEDASTYCEWFRPFAEGFREVLREDGSLIIDIGGAWEAGTPTRSLYHFELLIMLCREYGFHLCLEHYWWNPSKLPTPAEWVNVRRVRVKDAVNCVWWLSPTPWPKANNRRVLAPYSDSMRDLLKNGYKATLRPSGHDISANFNRDNGGAVPPNLLAVANTESNSRYQAYCRDKNLPIHPARFPALLPEYFIRMLTDRGDMVLDPFGGSCVTGAVAESLGRKWASVELSEDYLRGALARFEQPPAPPSTTAKATLYEISTPCGAPVDESITPLYADGGRTRAEGVGGRKGGSTQASDVSEIASPPTAK